MYKLLLTSRYLRRKLIPLFALLAVTLCTAMLIVVLSIMGGFHDMLLTAGTKLMGDVKVFAGAEGIPRYEMLLEEIRKMPQTAAAAATIETWGLLRLPGETTYVVEVVGADPVDLDKVTRYHETLHWSRDKLAEQGLSEIYGDADPLDAAMHLTNPFRGRGNADDPPMVAGIEVNPYNRRNNDGTYDFIYPWLGQSLTLTVVPVSTAGDVMVAERGVDQFVVVNEFHSGLYDVDSKRIYVPFERLQKLLVMDSAPIHQDPLDPASPVVGEVPARASSIIVRAVEGVSPEQLRDAISALYDQLSQDYNDLPPQPFMAIKTWQELLQRLLDTVRNEKNLMTFLFGIISFVAVIMVLVIFYMIVLEKTRDIGILRALGASRSGVAAIFLMYAAVIGVIGSVLGTAIAWLVVTYINEIHAWMGDTFGIVIWDRSVYFFERIPNEVNWHEIGFIVAASVVASVLGAIIPALRAARVDPVQTLRYE